MKNEKYKVECVESWGDLYLQVTHNGYQWSSIRIEEPDYEIPKIIEALSKHLSTSTDGGTTAKGKP